MILQPLIFALLSAILGAAAEWVKVLLADLLAGPIDATFLTRLYDIIFGVEVAHPTATGDEKYTMAFTSAQVLRKDQGKEATVDDNQLNELIELAVRKMRLTHSLPRK